jgi:hypothetical protein
MEIEIIKPIENYEWYTISSFGNVFNTCLRMYKKPQIRGSTNNKYYKVDLYLNDGTQTRVTKSLHQLLAQAFIPNPENLKCIDHIDGNGLNNNLDNLRWCTVAQNNRNRQKQKNTKFEFKGISRRSGNLFFCSIGHKNEKINVGTYQTIEECAFAYNIASKALHKEFGCRNNVKKPVNSKQIKYRVYLALSKHFPEYESKAQKYERYKKYVVLYD